MAKTAAAAAAAALSPSATIIVAAAADEKIFSDERTKRWDLTHARSQSFSLSPFGFVGVVDERASKRWLNLQYQQRIFVEKL